MIRHFRSRLFGLAAAASLVLLVLVVCHWLAPESVEQFWYERSGPVPGGWRNTCYAVQFFAGYTAVGRTQSTATAPAEVAAFRQTFPEGWRFSNPRFASLGFGSPGDRRPYSPEWGSGRSTRRHGITGSSSRNTA